MGMQISSAEASWSICIVSGIYGSGGMDPGLGVGVERSSGMVDGRGHVCRRGLTLAACVYFGGPTLAGGGAGV